MKSFHAMKKARIAVVKVPGAARGTMTLRNACQFVAPSTWAACSISHGISRKNAESTQIDSGSENDTSGMMTPSQVSNRWMVLHMLNNGLTRETTGNAAMASATDKMNRLPGKSSRAI